MKFAFIVVAHLLTAIAKLLRPGGPKGLVIENLLLKQQLLVLTRPRKRAPNLRPAERLFFGLCPILLAPRRLLKNAVTIKPSTFLRLHKLLVRRKYKQLYSSASTRKPGPKGPSKDLVAAIVELKRKNPSFGYPRIARIISSAFDVQIDRNFVRRVLAKYAGESSGGDEPSWLTFLGHAKDSLWSIDFFKCESILLKSHCVLVIMDQYTRGIVGFGINQGDVDGPALCRMFNEAISGSKSPHCLSSDNDPLFLFHRFRANLRILEIGEIKTVPYVPTSHPFVERLIGTIRREYLDHTMFWNTLDLARKLAAFKEYYNEDRIHAVLNATPEEAAGARPKPVANLSDFRWRQTSNRLVQLPIAA